MNKDRDYIIGGWRGYVNPPSRIVLRIGNVEHSILVDSARNLFSLLALLLRETRGLPSVWASVLAHNLVTAGALQYASDREGAACYCPFCDAPIPRASMRRAKRHGCVACGGKP